MAGNSVILTRRRFPMLLLRGLLMLLLLAALVQQGVATCSCDTPGAGTVGYNRFTCTDSTTAHCAADEQCFATSGFAKGDWSSGCRKDTQTGAGTCATDQTEANCAASQAVSDEHRRQQVKGAMQHAWRNFKEHAWGKDELRPLSKRGDDRWGGYGVTLVDSLDTLWMMGLKEEFSEGTCAELWVAAREWVSTSLDFGHSDPLVDHGFVSVFETTIRSLGGLLGAYSLSEDQLFLQKAIELGERLLPAFNTQSGLPESRVRLQDGEVHTEHYRLSSSVKRAVPLSEVGTLQLEMRMLTQLSKCNTTMLLLAQLSADTNECQASSDWWPAGGDPKFALAADKALGVILARGALYDGLFPMHLDLESDEHMTSETGIAAFSDSFYEYVLKLWLWGSKKDAAMRRVYDAAVDGIHKRLINRSTPNRLPYLADFNGTHPATTMHHLSCFVPGMLALGASTALPDSKGADQAARDLKTAEELMQTCRLMFHVQPTGLAPDQVQFSHTERDYIKAGSFHKLVAQYKAEGMDVKEAAGAAVEWLQADALRDFSVASGKAEHAYVLRPEIAESLYILHVTTGNNTYKDWAWDLFSAIEKHCRVDGGYGAHLDVTDLEIGVEDSMESFFLAETLKYLWLIFADTNTLTDYVLNTEAHPFAIPK